MIGLILSGAASALCIAAAYFWIFSGRRTSLDCGVVSYLTDQGRAILFKPQEKYQSYIREYILSQRGLMCKFGEKIDSISYKAVLFNRKNRAFRVISVVESVGGGQFSRLIELPKNTAFVSLEVQSANGITLKKQKSRLNLAVFAAIVGVICVVQAFFAAFFLAQTYGGLFSSTFLLSSQTVITVFTAGLFSWLVILGAILALNRRVAK